MDLANSVAAVLILLFIFFVACCGLIPSVFNDIFCFGKKRAS